MFWSCLDDASLLHICVVGVGPPTASRCNGPRVPWVSLPGPTGVPPMPKQDGIGSRAPTLVVALCRWWWTCHVDVPHTRVLQAASVHVLNTRFCCNSLSTRSWYFCNRSSCAGTSVEGVGVIINNIAGSNNGSDCPASTGLPVLA